MSAGLILVWPLTPELEEEYSGELTLHNVAVISLASPLRITDFNFDGN